MPCTLYLYPSRLRFLSDNKQVKRRERFLCFRHGRVQLWATYTPHFGPSSSFVPTTMSFLSLSLSLFLKTNLLGRRASHPQCYNCIMSHSFAGRTSIIVPSFILSNVYLTLSLSLSLSLQLSAFSAGRQLFDFILYIYIYINFYD